MTIEKIKLSNLNLPGFNTNSLPGEIKEVIKTLSLMDCDIYLIGGYVRDMLLKQDSTDLDFIVIDVDTVELCEELVNKFNGNYFILDELTKTVRFVLKEDNSEAFTLDFTPTLKANLEKDFARRDFTINTLAIYLKEPDVLIDSFAGLNDLKLRKIKAVSLDNLREDPLRFLRAFRFAAILNGSIEDEVIEYISNNLNYFDSSVSAERISTELFKILDRDNSHKYLKQVADSGLLEKIIPEFTPMKKVTPNDHHHLWLFDHTIELIKTFEDNFCKIPQWVQEDLNKSFGLLSSPTVKSIGKLGCLFHDIGKPGTWEIKTLDDGKNEKHTFYGHDKVGAEITEKIAERLKFSNSITETVCKLVRYHLRPFQLQQANAPITQRALYRFFRDVGGDTPLLLMLAMADLYATCGPKVTEETLLNGERLLLFLFEEYRKYKDYETEKAKKPKLLDGNEIMKLTSLKPSPILGQLMKDLDEAIAIGEVKTKDEATAWVIKIANS